MVTVSAKRQSSGKSRRLRKDWSVLRDLLQRHRGLGPVAIVGLICSGAATASPADAATDSTGSTLVALWHLDELPDATLTMVDSSGSGHDGQVSPDVTRGVPGYTLTAYDFSGQAPLVRVPSAPDLNPGSAPLTISAYLKVPADLTAGDYNVIQKGPANTPGGAYKLEIFGKSGSKFGYPDCAFNSPGSVKNRVFGPRSINDGAWYEVQCHLTSTQAYVTVDGVSGLPARRTVGSIANTVDVTLGGKPNNTHYFSGSADEVAIIIEK